MADDEAANAQGRFAYVDARVAAQMFNIDRLRLVQEIIPKYQIRTYGGPSHNPFLKVTDLAIIAEAEGISRTPDVNTRASLKNDGAHQIKQRLTADRRWLAVTESDMRLFLEELDAAQLPAVRAEIGSIRDALDRLLTLLDEKATQQQ